MDTEQKPLSPARTPPLRSIPTPTIPAAFDGGLGYNDIERDPTQSILVQVGPATDFAVGDTLQILWGDGRHIVAQRPLSEADRDKSVDIYVPATEIRRIGEGLHTVIARLVNPSTLPEPIDSPPATVKVKLTLPGGIDPEPTTPHENEKLSPCTVTPTEIPPSLEGVTVTVPAYLAMAEGDLITISWHGHFLNYGPLSAGAVGRGVVVPIPADIIRAAGGPEVRVRYEVRDEVNNWSLWSPVRFQDVPIDNPGAPTAPWVAGTTGNAGRELDMDRIGAADITVTVENHGGDAGDGITVHWKGMTAAGQPTRHDTDERLLSRFGETLTFTVPNARATELVQGHVNVTYTLRRQGGPAIESHRRLLGIVGTIAALEPPAVVEAIGGVLDPGKVPTGATVRVRPWAGIALGDICTLEWRGTRSDGSPSHYDTSLPVTGAAIERGVTFVVPAASVRELLNGRVRLRYTIDTLGQARTTEGVRNYVLAHLESPWLELEVRDGASALLPAPTVPEAVDGVLDPKVSPFAHLQIPASGFLRVGDDVEASIRGGRVPFRDSTRVANPALPPRFLLERAFIEGNVDQKLEASYIVMREGFAGQSAPYALVIGQVVETPPAPELPDFSDELVDLSHPSIDYYGGLRMRVPAYPGMAKGQRIQLRFDPERGEPWNRIWEVEQVGPQPILLVPKGRLLNVFDAGARRARIVYRVTAAGADTTVESAATDIRLTETRLRMYTRDIAPRGNVELANVPVEKADALKDDFEDAPGGPFRRLDRPAMVIETDSDDVLVWDGKKRWIVCPWCPTVPGPEPPPPAQTEFPPFFMGARIAYGGNGIATIRFTFRQRCKSLTFGYGCYGPGGGGRKVTVHAFDPENKPIKEHEVVTPNEPPGNCLFVTMMAPELKRIAAISVTVQGEATAAIPMLDNFTIEY